MSRILTGDKLIESVRNRAMVPSDNRTFDDNNILAIANEEMDVQLLDKLLSIKEGHLATHIDIPKNSEGIYNIPDRAIGNKLMDVSLLEGNQVWETTQIGISELPDHDEAYSSIGMDRFYIEGNQIKLIQPTRSYEFVRMYFYIRPNVLTKVNQAAIIKNIVNDVNAGITTFTFSSMPNKFQLTDGTLGSTLKYDIVDSKSPNKILLWDLTPTSINTSLKALSFNTSDLESQLKNIKQGDFITFAEESPVPNIPTEMHPVLAQLTAVHILEAMGDTEGLNNAKVRLDRMVASTVQIVDDRVELAPKKIKPKHGTLTDVFISQNLRRRKGY